jgi:hypothetical protein
MKHRMVRYIGNNGTYNQHGFSYRTVRKPKSYLGAYIVAIALVAILANIAYYLS